MTPSIVTVDAARLNRLIAVAGELKTQLAERDRRIAELEADKERLDWLEKAYGKTEGFHVAIFPEKPGLDQVIEVRVLHSAGTLRAAIDAARKERAR